MNKSKLCLSMANINLGELNLKEIEREDDLLFCLYMIKCYYYERIMV